MQVVTTVINIVGPLHPSLDTKVQVYIANQHQLRSGSLTCICVATTMQMEVHSFLIAFHLSCFEIVCKS